MKTVVALHGLPGVGKSAVATELGALLDAHVRHCGDLVKAKAQALEINLDVLGAAEHKEIDRETQRMVQEVSSPLIIEGRFLPEVLADIRGVCLVELTCSQAERERRHAKRSESSLALQDVMTLQLRGHLYGAFPASLKPNISIDTENLSEREVAEQIVKYVATASVDPT